MSGPHGVWSVHSNLSHSVNPPLSYHSFSEFEGKHQTKGRTASACWVLSARVCVFWEWAKLFTLLLCLVSNCVQWQLIGCFLKKIMKAFSTRRWATAWSRSWSFHGMDLPVFWLPLLGPHLLSHMLINHGRMIVKNLKMSPTNAISVSFFQQAS